MSNVKRKANSTIEHQKCKGHDKRDRLLTSKMKNIRFPSEIKVIRIDPVFSNYVNFNKKVFIVNCATKSFKAIYFFKVQKLKALEKTSQFFFQFSCVHYSFPTVSWLCLIIACRANFYW